MRAVLWGITDPDGCRLGWFMGADFEDAYKEVVGTHPADLSVVNLADRLGILDRVGSTISTHPDQRCKIHLSSKASHGFPAVDLSIETISGYDPLKIGRDEPDFLVGCEVSRWETRELWDRAQGRLARKYPKAWGYFSGSPETDRGWFSEIWNLGQGPNEIGLKSFRMDSSSNRVLYPLGRDDPAIIALRNSMSAERFAARHEGRFITPLDAVLPEFKVMLHVWPIQYVEGYPAYVMIDPGTKVCAVLFVQLVGQEVHVLDEVYVHQQSYEQVIQSTMMSPFWKYVREGTIDVAGRAHVFGQGSPEEAWFRDTGLQLRSAYHKLEHTVERLRSVLAINPISQRPRLLVHPRCRGLISELGGGPTPIPGGGLWRVGPTGSPRSDNCDALKALGYGLLSYLGTTRPDVRDFDLTDEEDTGVSYLGPAKRQSSPILDDLMRRAHAQAN